MEADWSIVGIYLSPGHNYFGHHGMKAGTHEMVSVTSVECVAGMGLVGDRFYDFKENYKGQVTFFASEVYDDLCQRFSISDKNPSVFRRNVITRGADLNAWIGRRFTLQGIEFEGVAECSPCHWMNEAFCEGAEKALAHRGGLRARILSTGILSTTAP